MQEPDESLLQSFAIGRDEKTFRALTERYLGLVFHTAMRRTGNRQLAEEVSQNVLCALAKKAGDLARHPERLGPWLHRATVFESLKAMRSESSHQRRKQLVHPDDIPGTHAGDSTWADALPVLDASLDKLPEADRTVLLLHFFEKRSFPQIARSLGKSTDAVQKQSRRALEKLSRLLRSKGVVLPAAVIVSGLTAEFAKAAPLSVSSSAASAFAVSSSPSNQSIAMIISKPKVLIPAVLLVCAIPLSVQQIAISEIEARNSELKTAASGPSGSPDITASRSRRAEPKTGAAAQADFMAIAKQGDEARRSAGGSFISGAMNPDLKRYYERIGALDSGALVRLIREGAGLTMDTNRKFPALQTLVGELGERDPKLALETVLDAFPEGPGFGQVVGSLEPGIVLGRWAAKDPAAAWSWFQENRSKGRIADLPQEMKTFSGNIGSFLRPLANALLDSDPALARELIQTVPMGERGTFLQSLHAGSILSQVSGYEKEGPKPVSTDVSLRRATTIWRLIREFAPMSAETVLPAVLSQAAAGFSDRSSTDLFLAEARLSGAEKLIAARYFIDSSFSHHATGDAAADDQRRREEEHQLAKELAPDDFELILEQRQAGEKVRNDRMVESRIQMLRSQPDVSDEFLEQTLGRYDFTSKLDAALEQAQRIRNPEKRRQVIERLRKGQ